MKLLGGIVVGGKKLLITETSDMKLVFEPLSVELLEWARQLHNDPEVLSMLTDPHIVSKEEQVSWFEKLVHSTSSERLVVFHKEEPVGVVRLDSIDYHNKSVCVGLDIHKDHRGHGLAKPIYNYLMDVWFRVRRFNRVWLLVAEYNHRALHIYKSLGFKIEGVMRKALLRDGIFYDYILMSVLSEEY